MLPTLSRDPDDEARGQAGKPKDCRLSTWIDVFIGLVSLSHARFDYQFFPLEGGVLFAHLFIQTGGYSVVIGLASQRLPVGMVRQCETAPPGGSNVWILLCSQTRGDEANERRSEFCWTLSLFNKSKRRERKLPRLAKKEKRKKGCWDERC